MLIGGISHADDGRSLLFTNAFAANYLKPSFPFDPSFPIAYPYYAFELSGFLYRGIQGSIFPSIALLATTIFLVSISFYSLFHLCKRIDMRLGPQIFFFTSIVLLVSHIKPIRNVLDGLFGHRVGTEVPQVYIYLHSHYHYLLGTIAGIVGIFHLWNFINKRERYDWILFITFFALSAGFSGIPFVWLAISALLILIIYLITERLKGLLSLAKMIPISVILLLFLLIPQIFTFLPRVNPNFELTLPHIWFADSSVVSSQMWDTKGAYGIFRSIIFVFDVLLTQLGLILGIGVLVIPIISLMIFWKKREWKKTPLHFFVIVIFTSFLLLTFTGSNYFWHAHGFLVSTVCASILIGRYLALSFDNKKNTIIRVAVIVILLIQTPFFAYAYFTNKGSPPSEEAIYLHDSLPLDAILYVYRHPLELSIHEEDPVYSKLQEDVSRAGRTIILPTFKFYSYLHNSKVLSFFGDPILFKPCNKTRYGTNTPGGFYYEFESDKINQKYCTLENIVEITKKPFLEMSENTMEK